jgi:hypothetical protein
MYIYIRILLHLPIYELIPLCQQHHKIVTNSSDIHYMYSQTNMHKKSK